MLKRIIGVAIGLALMCGSAFAENHCMGGNLRPGGSLTCAAHWQVDMQGREWPVTVQVTQPPAHGTISTTVVPRVVTVHGGQRTVHATVVTYHAKPGYIGEDKFTYVRSTKDPTDSRNGSIAVVVTMR
jgi:hypothetical protein